MAGGSKEGDAMTNALRTGILLWLSGASAWGGSWKPRRAAEYLDAREKDWFAWPAAESAGGTCVSCHTGMTYLLARPALRKLLGEAQPTPYETGLLAGLKERTEKNQRMFGSARFAKEPLASQGDGVQSILTALLLARSESSPTMSPVTEQAFSRMWAAQKREGPTKGAWAWFDFNDDPYETQDSAYYGATLAALAVGAAPTSYREQPDVKARVVDLAGYLQSGEDTQPLHNRLMLLWVSAATPDAWPRSRCGKLVDEALGKQQADGGWTMESLGPWKDHPEAAISSGSNNYATAVVALALEQAGWKASHPSLSKALRWLRVHQDPAGYWESISMNKRYDAGSMPDLFMRDGATAFAALALANADLRNRD
jgi:squalene-hopene/tetraprenyl-beta-curcumene cyclase